MRNIILIFSLFLSVVPASAQVKVSGVEPADWYAGMKNASLQLMVYGKGIRTADVEVSYPGVRVDSLVRLDSPNYLLVYLNLQGAQPGTMTLCFKNGGREARVKYELRRREMAGEERKGFDNADVLYMLMPDRFANGNPRNDQLKGMNAYVCDRTQPSLRHGGDLEGIRGIWTTSMSWALRPCGLPRCWRTIRPMPTVTPLITAMPLPITIA